MHFLIMLIYCIFPIASTPLILLFMTKYGKYKQMFIAMICLNLSIIAYYFIPPSDYDLNRYYSLMESIKYYDLDMIFENIIFKPEPLINFLFYMVSLTGIKQLLPMIVIFIGYFILIYMIWDYCQINKIRPLYSLIITLSLLCIINYIYFVSGIRNLLAFIMLSYAIYLDFIKLKKGIKYKILYLIPILIHNSCIVVLIIRACFEILNKIRSKYKYFLVLLWPIYFKFVLLVFSLFSNVPAIGHLISKSEDYLSNNITINDITVNLLFKLIIFFITMIILFISSIKKENKNKKLYEFLKLYSMFLLGTIQFKYVFGRFFNIYLILISFVFINYFSKLKKSKYIVLTLVFILSIIGLLIQIKMSVFKLEISIGKLFTSNILDLLIK